MFCSVIIPTIGRDSLERAVYSVLEQTLCPDNFEVIVVNDAGRPLPAVDWQEAIEIRVINTNRHERSVERNTGAAYAVAALIFPMHHLFCSKFWRGVLKPHFPGQGIALGDYKAELFGETTQKLNL